MAFRSHGEACEGGQQPHSRSCVPNPVLGTMLRMDHPVIITGHCGGTVVGLQVSTRHLTFTEDGRVYLLLPARAARQLAIDLDCALGSNSAGSGPEASDTPHLGCEPAGPGTYAVELSGGYVTDTQYQLGLRPDAASVLVGSIWNRPDLLRDAVR